ncbi:hypothetical protein NG798_01375 [Ancylothrix sp. C2]|uniref:hypothetical protein n=1 Tax=Ancylothrix sp. D3o TaxID=2953691 RepID=UPI0021BAF7CE|nr:hypothetical protein [Ancylothrix sp. D3o]MCT7948430.1 hypothetical protein [Ancylothrix sp. D3o]
MPKSKKRSPRLPPLVLVWFFTVLTIITLTAIAIFGLIFPGSNKPQPPQTDGSIPKEAIIIIIVTCAGGSLAILKWLSQ